MERASIREFQAGPVQTGICREGWHSELDNDGALDVLVAVNNARPYG